MAVLARPRRGSDSAFPAAFNAPRPEAPAVYASSSRRERLANTLPLAMSVLLASVVFWAPLQAGAAGVFAVGMLAFFGYWTVRSYSVAVACFVGMARLKRWERVDWHARYEGWAAKRFSAPAWEWPRHLVIIPNFKEHEAELRRTLDSLALQPNAKQLLVVLAMEERETGAEGKAARLLLAYRDCFDDLFATYHPAGIPAETSGKGSNEAWATREAHHRVIDVGGEDITRFTVTSCDADAVFGPQHFVALNYLFLVEPDRYRAFWQPAIFNSNNIWDIPAPLRILDGLSGINRLANLTLPGSVKFPTSCYSLSWEMLEAVGYWDEEVIPEDWHLFLKCCYALGDEVHVVPMYIALGNDCVLTDSYTRTLRAHYFQAVRHAWGASDISYAWRATWRGGRLSLGRRLLLASTVTKVHVLWVAQWYLVTLGVLLPMRLAKSFGAPMPRWWLDRRFEVPGMTWHFATLLHSDRWTVPPGVLETRMWLNPPSAMIAICILPLFVLVATEFYTRGPRPAYVSRFTAVRSVLVWPLMAPITFVWASMPALHAQWRLASGRGLAYRVAEKGSKQLANVRHADFAEERGLPGPAASREQTAAVAEAGAITAGVFVG